MWGEVYDHIHYPDAFLEHSTDSNDVLNVEKINTRAECYNTRLECYNTRLECYFSKLDLITTDASSVV